MPDSRQCLDARASLDEIRSLRRDFESAYAGAAVFGNPDGAVRATALREAIEGKVAALREIVAIHEAERMFDLRRQYDSQTSLLRRAGLVQVETVRDGSGAERETLFMTGIDGKKYPMPSYETVALRMAERRELLSTKADQGFTRLLLVPFGMSLQDMVDNFSEHLRRYKGAYDAAHGSDPVPATFELNQHTPINVESELSNADVSGANVYDPVRLDAHNGGQFKNEILAAQEANGDSAAGWRVLLLQSAEDGTGFRDIPRQGSGTLAGTKNPRQDIETGRTPESYVRDLQDANAREDSPYFGESGMCPEEWLVLFLAHLEETGKPLDDFYNDAKSKAVLTGTCAVDSGRVPMAVWDSFSRRQVQLMDVTPAYHGLSNDFAPRYAVRV